MPFLTVASIEVPVAADGAQVSTTEIGDRVRAFDGTMRVTVTARKRTWRVKTGLLLLTDAAALRAALLASPTVSASGDWIGGTVTVWPVVGDDTPVATSPVTVVMNFTLEEQ